MSSINASQVLETKPVGKLLLQYSIPAIIGMTVTSLYNIIDSVFIGHGGGAVSYIGFSDHFSLDEPDYCFFDFGGHRGCDNQFDLSWAERHGENKFCLGERVVVMHD